MNKGLILTLPISRCLMYRNQRLLSIAKPADYLIYLDGFICPIYIYIHK